MIYRFILSPDAEESGPSEPEFDPLVGSWRIERSVPYTTHESFVFSDDDSMVILDAQATVIERQILTQRTENSFVGTENAINLGRRLGADLVLTGQVFRIGRSITIFGRVVDTRTGIVETSGRRHAVMPMSQAQERCNGKNYRMEKYRNQFNGNLYAM